MQKNYTLKGEEHGEQRRTLWEPQPRIVNALERAFYRSFSKVRPTGKQIYKALALSDGNDLVKHGAW
ncbi:hypothetical protein DPMN_100673 [Dreissena polymorpha]|uniref:Uncharacterized protein n=1 Tax=Dreissena polymorpha TaxID=45954 RepID=A0A9D4LHV3_DREPO|nr:hypothetical protein DPMN_100673 [Dreissena polymorpha]